MGYRISTFLLGCALAVSASSASYTGYPSTYPYENEPTQMPDVLDMTPDDTYLDTDPGGYLIRAAKCDLNDPEFWETWMGDYFDFCAFNTYYSVVAYNTDAVWGVQAWNCTAGIYTGNEISGLLNGVQVCNPGECCPEFTGSVIWNADFSAFTFLWDQASSSGVCGDMTEPMYCLTTGSLPHYCIQYFITPSERQFQMPCHDQFYYYYMTCPAFKASGIIEVMKGEDTPSYLAKHSPEQQFKLHGYGYSGDRVCFPYSYYNPASVASADSSDTAEAPDVDEDDSAVFAVSAISAILIPAVV